MGRTWASVLVFEHMYHHYNILGAPFSPGFGHGSSIAVFPRGDGSWISARAALRGWKWPDAGGRYQGEVPARPKLGTSPSATLSRGAAYRLEVDPQPGTGATGDSLQGLRGWMSVAALEPGDEDRVCQAGDESIALTGKVGLRPALVGPRLLVVSYRQHSNPASALVNHDQGARGQVGLMLVESGDDRAFQVVGEDVRGANLKHARAGLVR